MEEKEIICINSSILSIHASVCFFITICYTEQVYGIVENDDVFIA